MEIQRKDAGAGANHLDIDVLDAALFHSTYFANKDFSSGNVYD